MFAVDENTLWFYDDLVDEMEAEWIGGISIKMFKEVGGIGKLPLKGGRMGHGQGMMITEPPSISALDDTVIEPGFTLSTEPGFGDGLHIWEDVHLITDDGHEQLSTETEELREI